MQGDTGTGVGGAGRPAWGAPAVPRVRGLLAFASTKESVDNRRAPREGVAAAGGPGAGTGPAGAHKRRDHGTTDLCLRAGGRRRGAARPRGGGGAAPRARVRREQRRALGLPALRGRAVAHRLGGGGEPMQDADRGARQRRRDALDAGGAASRRRAARRARLRLCPPARPRRAPAPAPAVQESPPAPAPVVVADPAIPAHRPAASHMWRHAPIGRARCA